MFGLASPLLLLCAAASVACSPAAPQHPAMPLPTRVLTEVDAERPSPALEAGDRIVVRLPAKGSPWRLASKAGPVIATAATSTEFGFQTHAAGRVQLEFATAGGRIVRFVLEVR